VVSTAEPRLVVVVTSTGSSDGRASVGSVVAWADIMARSSEATSSDGGSGDFGVAETTVLAGVALPELGTGALGVAVGGAGTVALLLLVVLVDEELKGNGDEEKEGSDDGDSEAGSVEPTDGSEGSRVGVLVTLTTAKALLGVLVSVAERGVNVAAARRGAVTGQDSNRDHGTAAEEVEDHSEHGEDGLSAEEAGQEDCKDGVEHHGAGQTLNGLLPSWDGDIAISLDGEEVAVYAENDPSAAELERIERS